MLNIKKELLVFFCACLTGVNVRAGYEILIFLRKMIIHNNLVKGIEDLFYWIFMSAYIFSQIYATTYGSIRWSKESNYANINILLYFHLILCDKYSLADINKHYRKHSQHHVHSYKKSTFLSRKRKSIICTRKQPRELSTHQSVYKFIKKKLGYCKADKIDAECPPP